MLSECINVFLSSTSHDLADERGAVEAAIRRMNVPLIAMEYFGSDDQNPIDISINAVRRSSVYIGIVGFRYGELSPDCEKSYTEREYDAASEIGIPRLIYFKGEQAKVRPSDIEIEKIKREKLDAFRRRLSTYHTVSYFTDPADLASMIAADLHRLLSQREQLTRVVHETDYAQMPRVVIKRAEMALLAALQTLDELHKREKIGEITRTQAYQYARIWFRNYHFRFDGDFSVWDSERLTHWHSSERFIGKKFRFSDYSFDEFFSRFLGRENGGIMKWIDQFSSDYLFKDNAFYSTREGASWIRFNIAPFGYFPPWDWYVLVEAHNELHELTDESVKELLANFRSKDWLVIQDVGPSR